MKISNSSVFDLVCYHVNKITSVVSKNSNFGAQFAVALLCFVYRKSGQRDSKLTNVRILKNLKNTKPRHIQKMEVGVDDDSGIKFCLFVYFSQLIFNFLFTFSAICLLFWQLFVYFLTAVYFLFLAVCLLFWQLFIYFCQLFEFSRQKWS